MPNAGLRLQTSIGVDTTFPFSVSRALPADGAWTLKVVATDNALNTTATSRRSPSTAPPADHDRLEPGRITNQTGATFDFSSNDGGATFGCASTAAPGSPAPAPSSTAVSATAPTPSTSAQPTPPATPTLPRHVRLDGRHRRAQHVDHVAACRPDKLPERPSPSPRARAPRPSSAGSTAAPGAPARRGALRLGRRRLPHASRCAPPTRGEHGRQPGRASAGRSKARSRRRRRSRRAGRRARRRRHPRAFEFSADQPSDDFKCSLDDRAQFGNALQAHREASFSSLAEGSHYLRRQGSENEQRRYHGRSGLVRPICRHHAAERDDHASPPTRRRRRRRSFRFTPKASRRSSSPRRRSLSRALARGATAACPRAAHTFTVRATDPAGNTDPRPASRTWTVDTTRAGHDDRRRGPSSRRTRPRASFAFTATETRIDLRLQASTAAPERVHEPEDLRGLAEGSHTFPVRATDAGRQHRPEPGQPDLDGRHDRARHDDRLGPGRPERRNATPTFSFELHRVARDLPGQPGRWRLGLRLRRR